MDAITTRDGNYLASLKRLLRNRAFVLLLITYGKMRLQLLSQVNSVSAVPNDMTCLSVPSG
jgi:hypothetical protein